MCCILSRASSECVMMWGCQCVYCMISHAPSVCVLRRVGVGVSECVLCNRSCVIVVCITVCVYTCMCARACVFEEREEEREGGGRSGCKLHHGVSLVPFPFC